MDYYSDFSIKDVPSPPPPTVPHPRRKCWERFAPRQYISTVHSARPPTSLHVDIQLTTTDEGLHFRTRALIDSGATGSFIDRDYVTRNRIPTKRLSRAIPVYNVDGTRNEAGSIMDVVDVVIDYKGHGERTVLAVTSLGSSAVILGYTWLREHNPEINWQTQEIKLSRCPTRCQECRREVRAEKSDSSADSLQALRRLLSKPVRTFPESAGENIAGAGDSPEAFEAEDEFSEGEEDGVEGELEEGDRLFATAHRPARPLKRVDDRTAQLRAALDARARRLEGLLGIERPPAHTVAATSTISQRIAESHANLERDRERAVRGALPHAFWDFQDVFEKESFDTLPEHREWDHAIELITDPKAPTRKLYPLSPVEQRELDKFIEENVSSGRIRPSKSPIAAPFFFIKEKGWIAAPGTGLPVLELDHSEEQVSAPTCR